MTVQAMILAALTFLLICCALVMVYVGTAYRAVMGIKQEADRSFAALDKSLQDRFEASGELMEVCRGFVPRDSREMRTLVEIRSVWAIADNKSQRLKAAVDSERALKDLVAAARSHPDLQSADYFGRVERRLATLNQTISTQREKYNSVIAEFNDRLRRAPMSWVSGSTGLSKLPAFASSAASESGERANSASAS
jgi:LemA protein